MCMLYVDRYNRHAERLNIRCMNSPLVFFMCPLDPEKMDATSNHGELTSTLFLIVSSPLSGINTFPCVFRIQRELVCTSMM